jgi:hypothetical protein
MFTASGKLLGGRIVITPGTLGFFGLGNTSAVTNLYTFSSDGVAPTTSFTATMDGGQSASIPSTVITSKGSGGALTFKYKFAGATMVAGTGLQVNTSNSGSNGNSTVGIFGAPAAGGTSRYLYSNDTTAVGGSFTANMAVGEGNVGNSTTGYFGLSTGSATNKYTYSNDGVVAGTNLVGGAAANGGAAGNSVQGVFAIGSGVSGAAKYVYSGDVVSAGTAFTGGTLPFNGTACGTATAGIFAIGNGVANTVKYTYSNDATVAAGSMTAAVRHAGAASNGISGVNM